MPPDRRQRRLPLPRGGALPSSSPTFPASGRAAPVSAFEAVPRGESPGTRCASKGDLPATGSVTGTPETGVEGSPQGEAAEGTGGTERALDISSGVARATGPDLNSRTLVRGRGISRERLFLMGLILAQDERWRRASCMQVGRAGESRPVADV